MNFTTSIRKVELGYFAFGHTYKWTSFFFFLLMAQVSFGQATISGSVVSPTDEPVAFANVLLLLQSDSSLVKGAVSDESGAFAMEQVAEGNYLISVSMVGYETSYGDHFDFDGSADYQVGNLILNENSEVMDEVVVAALRPLYDQKIDRMVINVQNSITSAGGNALEVLARSPGVEVNEISEVLAINGKSGVQILIDGKLSRLSMNAILDLLRGMDASNIDKIELYDTPPAHLDAEGNGGVINIVMKENKELGTNGSYSVNVGRGRNWRYGGSVNLNHRTDKFNIYANYSLSHRFTKQTYLFDRTVDQMGTSITTDSENDRDGEGLRNSAQIGFDYNLSKKTILGFLASGYLSNSDNTANNISTFTENAVLSTTVKNINKETINKQYGMLNLNLQHHFKAGESVSFDVDYLHFKNDNPSSYLNDFYNGDGLLERKSEVVISNNTPIDNISAKVDYSKTLSDKLNLQVGLKGTRSVFDNSVLANEIIGGNEVKMEGFSQDSDLEESIGAAYVSFGYQLDANTRIQGGLRYEYTDYLLTTPDDPNYLDQNYGNFFPSFFLSKNINEFNQFQFSYSRRISRPAFNEIAPFATFIDPNTFFIGNNELQPGISDNLKTSYKFKTVLVTLQYAYSQDVIATYQPQIDPETNTQFYTTLNLDEEHSSRLSILLPFHPTKWWDIQSQIAGSLERLIIKEEEKPEVNLDTKAITLDLVNTFKLPNQFSLEVAAQYKSAAYYGLLEVQPRGYVNIGLQKRFRNGGTLRFNCSDLFQTNVWKSKTVVPELNLRSDLVVGIETRVATLSYSAPFGKSTVKGKRRRATGSQEEQRRIY